MLSDRDKRNALLNTIGESLWGFQASLVAASTVLTVLLQSYGAGKGMIGGISAIEIGIGALPQLLGIYVFTSRKHRKRDLILWHIVCISPFLLAMSLVTFYAPHMPAAVYRWIMLASFVCFMAGIGIVLAVWLDWIAHIFDVGIRGRVMGVAFFGSAFAGTAGALAAGWIITHVAAPQSYAFLYLAACVFSILSILTFVFIDDPAVKDEDVRVRPDTAELMARIGKSLKMPNFRSYLVGRILAMCGFCIIPFIAVHYSSATGGGLREGTIVSCGAGMAFGMALGSLILGRMGDTFGHRLGVLIGAALQVASLLVMILMPGLAGCVVAYFTAGFCAPGAWVSHTNVIIETCPHDSRVAHISAGNLVVGACAIVVPLLAGAAAGMWGTIRLFEINLAFSVVAFLWFLFRVKEPREEMLNDEC